MFYPARMKSPRFALMMTTLLTAAAASGFAGESLVYFGTYSGAKSQGIYVSRFEAATGKLSAPELVAEIKNPTFLAVAPGGNFLYAVSEVDEIGGKPTGAAVAFA